MNIVKRIMSKNDKGVATIEAAVIVPLFTIIIVLLIKQAIMCHDNTLNCCTYEKVCILAEFEQHEKGRYMLKGYDEYGNKAKAYFDEKKISNEDQNEKTQVSNGLLYISADDVKVLKNNPVEYVWKITALKKFGERITSD